MRRPAPRARPTAAAPAPCGELEILRRSGLPPAVAPAVLTAAGLAEVGFALATAHPRSRHAMLLAHFAVMPALALGALRADRSVFAKPFNPASLTASMLGLAAAALLTRDGRPSAARCLRAPAKP